MDIMMIMKNISTWKDKHLKGVDAKDGKVREKT